MNNLDLNKEALYNGSELNADTFNDFVDRLRFHSRGKGVDDHCTSDAIFIVEAKRMFTGIDLDYCDNKCIHDHEDCETYYSLEDFIERLDDDSLAHYELNDFELPFLEMSESDQWDALSNVDALSISGFDETWEYVNAHFTKEAAERFIKRKSHDYRGGLRIFVNSQYYAWEFNAIKNAILDGQLVFKESK